MEREYLVHLENGQQTGVVAAVLSFHEVTVLRLLLNRILADPADGPLAGALGVGNQKDVRRTAAALRHSMELALRARGTGMSEIAVVGLEAATGGAGAACEPFESEPPQMASESQRRLIRDLGGTIEPGSTWEEAESTIRGLRGLPASVTNRQWMVLRFWDKQEIAKQGRTGVSEWMTGWYAEDPDRRTAWEIWKLENRDDGGQGDPRRVPVGIGPQYLERIKRSGG